MNDTLERGRRPRRARAVLALAALSAVSTPTLANTRNWIGGTSTWDNAAAWSATVPPGQPGQPLNGDQVFIDQSDASVTYANPANPAAVYSDFEIGLSSSNTATFNQSLSTLNTNQFLIGVMGKGAAALSGGALNVQGAVGMSLGSSAGGNGALTLSSSAVLTINGQATIGDAGTGTVTQTGGRMIITPLGGFPGVLALGSNPASSGTYTISGGTVESGSFQLSPFGGNALVNQTGGSITLTADLSLTDPTLPGLGGSAIYNHSGGSVEAQQVNVAMGTYTLSGSASLSTVSESLGGTSAASAIFAQTGGTHFVTGTGSGGLVLGPTAGTQGVLNLSGGTLTTGATRIALAGGGTFTHTGGTHTAGQLVIGPASGQSGLYTLSSPGVLNVTGDFIVGVTPGGTATYTQTGGQASVGSGTNGLMVGTGGGSGTVNLQGGSLTTFNAYIGRTATGVFNNSGGAHVNSSIMNIGDQASSPGTYTLSGSGTLMALQMNVGVGSTGLFNHNANSATVTGSLRLGSVTPVTGTYTMAAGTTLSAGTESVGVGGNGVFNQNGGTHTVVGSNTTGLTLGELSTGSGTFTLSAGMLNTPTVRVALSGNGTFNHSGGTHNVSGVLTIGPTGAKSGTYTLSGSGVLNAASIVVGAGNTNAAFIQNAGSTTATNVAVLPGARFNALGGSALVTGDFNNSGTLVASLSSGLMINGGLAPNGTAIAGITTINTGSSITADFVRQNTLTVNGSGIMSVRAKSGGGDTSVLKALTLQTSNGSPTATLDLADNGLIVDYTGGTSSLPTIKSAIIASYNPTAAAHWTAPGITSSVAALNANFAVGYGEASTALGISGTQTASWQGQTVDATSVLARYTLAGDANLDGVVDFADLVKLAQNYGTTDGSRDWSTGNSTYDGNVDFNDLVRLAQNYGAALPAQPIPGASPVFECDLAAAFASAPEPSGIAIFATLMAGFMRRRRSV